jgi:hypothetical protein
MSFSGENSRGGAVSGDRNKDLTARSLALTQARKERKERPPRLYFWAAGPPQTCFSSRPWRPRGSSFFTEGLDIVSHKT